MIAITVGGAFIDEQHHLLLSGIFIATSYASVGEMQIIESFDYIVKDNDVYYCPEVSTWLPYYTYIINLTFIVTSFQRMLNKEGIEGKVVIGIFERYIQRNLPPSYYSYSSRIISFLHHSCRLESFKGSRVILDKGFQHVSYKDYFTVENMNVIVHLELKKEIQQQYEDKSIQISNINFYTYSNADFLIAYEKIQLQIEVNEEAARILNEVQQRDDMEILQDSENQLITIASKNQTLDISYVFSRIKELEKIGYKLDVKEEKIENQLYTMYKNKSFQELDLKLGFGKNVYIPYETILGKVQLESVIASDERFDMNNLNKAEIWKAIYSYTGNKKIENYNTLFELIQKYCSNIVVNVYPDKKKFEVRAKEAEKFCAFSPSELCLSNIPKDWYNEIILSSTEILTYGYLI